MWEAPRCSVKNVRVEITGQVIEIQGRAKAASEDPAPGASAGWWKVVSLKTLWPGPLGTYAKFLNRLGEITSRLYFGDLVWGITLFKVGWKCFNHCIWGDSLKESGCKAYSHYHSNGSIGRGDMAAGGGPGSGMCGGRGRGSSGLGPQSVWGPEKTWINNACYWGSWAPRESSKWGGKVRVKELYF